MRRRRRGVREATLLYCRIQRMNELRVNKVIALTRTQNNKKHSIAPCVRAYLQMDAPRYAARVMSSSFTPYCPL